MKKSLFDTLLFVTMITILAIEDISINNISAMVLIGTLILNNILTKVKLKKLELEFYSDLNIEFKKRSRYDVWGLLLLLCKSVIKIFEEKSIFNKEILNILTKEEVLALVLMSLVIILSVYELIRMSTVKTRVYWEGILFDDGIYFKWNEIKDIEYGEVYDKEGYLNLQIKNVQGRKQEVDIKGEDLDRFNELYESKKEILLYM